MRLLLLVLCLSGLITFATPGRAAAEDDFSITVTPYIWIAWPKGDISARTGDSGGAFPEINANFDDVELSGVFTGSADLRYQSFGLFGDFSYFEVEAKKHIDIVGDVFVDGKVGVAGTKAMVMGYWRPFVDEDAYFDVMAGVHYLEPELTLDLATARRSFSGEVEKSWTDLIVGVRGYANFTEHFGVDGFATYGGGGDSESLYDLYAAAHWRFNSLFTASLGYRYFADEFDGDELDYDVSFSGPLMGLSFTF